MTSGRTLTCCPIKLNQNPQRLTNPYLKSYIVKLASTKPANQASLHNCQHFATTRAILKHAIDVHAIIECYAEHLLQNYWHFLGTAKSCAEGEPGKNEVKSAVAIKPGRAACSTHSTARNSLGTGATSTRECAHDHPRRQCSGAHCRFGRTCSTW